jgi:hypothetical protein
VSAQPEGLGDLSSLVRLADPDSLVDHLGRLAGPLGLDAADVEHLSTLDGDDLAQHLRAHLGGLRRRDRATRGKQAEARAHGAAARLARTARWDGSTVYLEPSVLLGELPAHPTAKVIGFDLDGDITWVSKKKLRQARRALRGFDDIRVYVVHPDLRIRWRGGLGGLDLHARAPRHGEDSLVVRLHGPAEVHSEPEATQVPHRRRRPPTGSQRPGAWIGDILADLGLS